MAQISQGSRVQRVPVWSGRLRLLHWLLAAAVLFMLATGFLLGADLLPFDRRRILDVHVNMGYVAFSLVVLRLLLLVGGARTDHWRDLVAIPRQGAGITAMLRFYLTLGRAPMPVYYGHNPLWGPLYLLLLGLLVAQSLTGIAGGGPWHALGYGVILLLVAAHLVAVLLHDWRGTAAEISAMVNGSKVFVVEPPAAHEAPPGDSVQVTLDLPRRPE